MQRFLLVGAISVFLLGAGIGAAGDEAEEDENTVFPLDDSVPSEKCIRRKMIRATEVIDERNILFHMVGKKVYRNVLPRRCRGLARGSAFTYNPRFGRLCSIDSISLLDASGFGIDDGKVCGLGLFYAMNEAEVQAIRLEAARIAELGLEKK